VKKLDPMNRALKKLVLAAVLGTPACPAASPDVSLGWLDRAPPAVEQGVSFGVPWPRGAVQGTQAFELAAGNGPALPLQSWPLAYWPDGSVKWTGFATIAGPGLEGPFKLHAVASGPISAPTVRIDRTETAIDVDTGKLTCRIPTAGDDLIEELSVEGRVVASRVRLVCILQDGPDGGPMDTPARTKFIGRIDRVTVEQAGPIRAVVKIEGAHHAEIGVRVWLPFVIRLYFFAGQESVRVVHTIVYDGNQDRDVIRGLGLSVTVPMREEVQNRHVCFSGEGLGLWAEPVQPLVGRQGRFVADPHAAANGSKPQDVFPDQIAGKRVPNRDQVSQHSRDLMADWAVWDGFKLVQPNADGFTILKRTNGQSSWLPAGADRRASGLAFAGDVTGGLAVSIRNFWQSYPTSLEIEGASTPEAEITAWLWSPDAPGMDMRHYDTRAHGLEASYEDVQPGMSTATGVARTSELTLFASGNLPQKLEFAKDAAAGQVLPLLVSSPEYIHSTGVFGVWSLPDRSTAFKRSAEEQLDAVVAVYEREIEQRHWYGFWTYGNVMHSYDAVRHVWRYDLGGMAWDNTELASDMWLWYSFLRTGRGDIFRMAEAMARNTSEVDVYHMGPFAGLGSRHNVVPWGDGAKEARISQAAFRRFYYYLTTDERIGDVMREVVNVDYKVAEVDPMRIAQPPNEREKRYPARVRIGPDWFAFAGNWMTEWERTGDTKWRDKINAGLDSISRMPLGMRSGRNLVFGYDPASGRLYQVSDELGDYNLATIQGGAEVVMELNGLIDNPGWARTWLQYCRLEKAPLSVFTRDMATGSEGADGSYPGTGRLAGYAYRQTGDDAFARVAISGLFGGLLPAEQGAYPSRHIAGPDVLNPIEESIIATNSAAQASLNAIEVLEMCADKLPTATPIRANDDHGRAPKER
jgi:hypothetical protein